MQRAAATALPGFTLYSSVDGSSYHPALARELSLFSLHTSVRFKLNASKLVRLVCSSAPRGRIGAGANRKVTATNKHNISTQCELQLWNISHIWRNTASAEGATYADDQTIIA